MSANEGTSQTKRALAYSETGEWHPCPYLIRNHSQYVSSMPTMVQLLGTRNVKYSLADAVIFSGNNDMLYYFHDAVNIAFCPFDDSLL